MGRNGGEDSLKKKKKVRCDNPPLRRKNNCISDLTAEVCEKEGKAYNVQKDEVLKGNAFRIISVLL